MTIMINTDIQMSFHECWVCGMPFAITEGFQYAAERKHLTFHCPNGCRLSFGESEADKLKKQLARERAKHDQTKARAEENWAAYEAEQRSKAAVSGHLTRVKKRVQNGVCPCCNRHFKDVQRHMASKHPEYAKDD